MALATFSERKQIDKVKSAALLSPIAFLSHMTTALGVVAAKAFVGEVSRDFDIKLITCMLNRGPFQYLP